MYAYIYACVRACVRINADILHVYFTLSDQANERKNWKKHDIILNDPHARDDRYSLQRMIVDRYCHPIRFWTKFPPISANKYHIHHDFNYSTPRKNQSRTIILLLCSHLTDAWKTLLTLSRNILNMYISNAFKSKTSLQSVR